jgi:DNA-binding CsgD family transcriptional regulator
LRVFDLASDLGRSVLDTSSFPIFILSSTGRICDVNAAACAYFEQTREQFLEVDALGIRGYSPARRAEYGKRFTAWMSGELFPFLVAWPPRTGSDRFLAFPQRTHFRGKPACAVGLIPAPIVEAALAGRAAESAKRAREWVRQQSRNTTRPAADPLLGKLTPREWEIARRLAEGDRVPLIVEDLDIAENTVRNHLKSIFRKLQVASQAQLVRRIKERTSPRED